MKSFLAPDIVDAHRGTSYCSHYPLCGGCQLIDIPYDKQLQLKDDYVMSLANRYYRSSRDVIRPIIGCEQPNYYRNKMEYAFSSDENGVYLGLKRRQKFSEIVRLEHCYLMSEESNDIRAFVSAFMTDKKVSTWNYFSHTGFLRHLVIRQSKFKNEYMLNLVTSEFNDSLSNELADALQKKFPSIRTFLSSINPDPGDHTYYKEAKIHFGDGILYEELGHSTFKISPLSFFQTNSQQAVMLYNTIRDAASLKKTDRILDLYCGAGTIGIYLAKDVASVIGIEENPSAIDDAHFNAHLNNCTTISFHLGRVKNILKFNTFDVDTVIVDPPRSGLVPKALRRSLEVGAPTFIYVSCNPKLMFKDFVEAEKHGYKVTSIQPVDMFPHTSHLECVARLDKH